MSRPRFADELRHTPKPPPSEAPTGRWIVEHAQRHPGGPPTMDRRQTVLWSLVLRHADDRHIESVQTNALTTTSYRAGETVYGTVTAGIFRRAKPLVGQGH